MTHWDVDKETKAHHHARHAGTHLAPGTGDLEVFEGAQFKSGTEFCLSLSLFMLEHT